MFQRKPQTHFYMHKIGRNRKCARNCRSPELWLCIGQAWCFLQDAAHLISVVVPLESTSLCGLVKAQV